MLAHDASPEARIAYAANDRADPVILAWLAHDPYRAVRITLAGRSRLARSILTVLARDADAGVREVIAVRPRLPRSVLEHLLGDAYLGVRIGAAMFHRLSPEYLAWCATNPAPAWRQVAAVARDSTSAFSDAWRLIRAGTCGAWFRSRSAVTSLSRSPSSWRWRRSSPTMRSWPSAWPPRLTRTWRRTR
jgi:hypothetical protein